jgi:hypothetical protein
MFLDCKMICLEKPKPYPKTLTDASSKPEKPQQLSNGLSDAEDDRDAYPID